jgi:hypothetical protein
MKLIFGLFCILFFLSTDTVFSLFEFDCAPYRVTGDSQAALGIAVTCRIWVCPGQTVEATLCGHAFGDNFLRLIEEGAVQREENDDYW